MHKVHLDTDLGGDVDDLCAAAPSRREGTEMEEAPFILEEQDGWLHERIDRTGKLLPEITKPDGPRFEISGWSK